MIIYFIMFILAEFFTFFTAQKYYREPILQVKGRKRHFSDVTFFYWMTCVPFLLIAVLRYKVGTDYTVYSRLQIPEVMRGINDRVEFLYRYVIKLGMAIGDKHWVFVLTHIIIIFFFWQAFKESENLPMTIFVFMFGGYFNLSLNTMRQFIAMAICLYATKYIYQEKLVQYAAWILVATLFHSTGAVYIIFYFLARFKLPKTLPLIATVAGFVLSNVARRVLQSLSSIFTIYEGYLGSEYDKMDTQWDYLLFNLFLLMAAFIYEYNYADKEKAHRRNSPVALFKDFFVRSAGIKTGYIKQEELKYQTYLWLQLFTALFASVSNVIPNSTRIIVLTGISQTLFVPMLIKKMRADREMQFLVTTGLVVLYFAIFYRKIIFGNYGQTIPYTFIWER